MADSSKYPTKRLEVEKYHKNVSQEVVEITTDKLRIILSQHIKKIERQKEWQTALGILLALVASLITAEFKTVFGVEAGVWKSLFILGAVASGVWLLLCAFRLLNRQDVEGLIRRITNEQ
jgi:predicted phage tail protein